MLSMKSIISAQVNGKSYDFQCAPDSPIDDALEANFQHRTFLIGRKQMISEAKNAKEQKPIEESSDVKS